MTKYWIGVASLDHVQKGMDGNFCQVCHGRSAPLKRMNKGDWIIYYSPKLKFSESEICRAFTAIAQIADGRVYSVQMSPHFSPYRRDVIFMKNVQPTPIKNLLDQLDFIEDKRRYGYKFRFGHFEISKKDFMTIMHECL